MKSCKICANEDCTWRGHADHISVGCLGFEPHTNADRIRSADTEIEMVDIILKLVKKIPKGEDKRRTLYQLLMREAENG